jgi:putative DNA primase/helicase
MVALVTDIRTGKPQAIHRTALDLAGHKIKVDGEERLSKGPTKGGCIRLTLDENVETFLGIGEGIETALSLQSLPEFGASPTWSCIHAKNIENFPVLSGIECLWIAVDHDDAGIIASEKCAERWHAAGREVLRLQPEKHKNDLNDWIKGASSHV